MIPTPAEGPPPHLKAVLVDPEKFVSFPPAGHAVGSLAHLWCEIAELRTRLARCIVDRDNLTIELRTMPRVARKMRRR